MVILITGGTGLIGRHLIAQLQDHQLIVLTRQGQQALRRYPTLGAHPNLRCISSLDLLEDEQAIHAIINLAGEPIADKRWTKAQKRRIEQSRFEITAGLIALIARLHYKPEVLLSGSAVGFYGRQRSQQVDESYTQVHAEFSHSLCQQWESIARQAGEMQVRVCLLRTGIVLCAEGGALRKMALPCKMGFGGPIASGEQYMPWIHIDDVTAAIVFLLRDSSLHGAFNLCAPNPVTNNTFSKMLARVLRRPNLLRMPAWLVRLLFGEMADLLIFGQRCVPNALKQAGFIFRYRHLVDALKQQLGAK